MSGLENGIASHCALLLQDPPPPVFKTPSVHPIPCPAPPLQPFNCSHHHLTCTHVVSSSNCQLCLASSYLHWWPQSTQLQHMFYSATVEFMAADREFSYHKWLTESGPLYLPTIHANIIWPYVCTPLPNLQRTPSF